MTECLLTIREMCETFEVTPRTLRFYESKELLAPRREGQKRLFTRRDCARMKLILRGKRFGFSLEELRQVLDLYDVDRTQRTQIARAFEIGQKRLVELRRQRDDLNAAIEELEAALAWGEKTLDQQARTNAA